MSGDVITPEWLAKRVELLEGQCEQLRKELDAALMQGDQVLHLLAGGTLSTEQVKESGLGVGVLIEKRHAEHMRQKAENKLKELTENIARHKLRGTYPKCAICGATISFVTYNGGKTNVWKHVRNGKGVFKGKVNYDHAARPAI